MYDRAFSEVASVLTFDLYESDAMHELAAASNRYRAACGPGATQRTLMLCLFS